MRKLSIILIIAGILVALSPIAGQLYNKYQEHRMMVEWLESEDAAVLEEISDADPEVGYSQLQEAFVQDGAPIESTIQTETVPGGELPVNTAEATAKPSPKPSPKPADKQTVLGIIQIEKIKVKALIVEGVKASNLSTGVGHIPGTAAPGEPGNCALAGHRSYTFGKFFNRLDEIVEGDEIVITTKKGDYKYKVFKKLVVTPDDLSVLRGSKSDSIITLITCTPIYVASHRLIVHARLEEAILKEP